MAAINELYSSDFVLHGGSGEDICGIENFKQQLCEFFNAFPDLHFAIEDMIVEGDKVVVRHIWTGTHTGVMGGIPPTYKKLMLWAISIDRIAGGKFVEEWERYDTLGLMQQLGVVPAPKK
jgi:steroid delta-isomerase-like uncharacterized protein